MTVIKFLSSYVQLYLNRAAAERIPDITVLYGETEEGFGKVHVGNAHGGITIVVGFGLSMEMNHEYTPVLTDPEWVFFKENIAAPAEPALLTCSGSGCGGNKGEANYCWPADTGSPEYYCGGSDRCCP